MNRAAVVMLMIAGIISSALGESTVVLKSGETLQGDILSDTNNVLQIRIFRADHTISSLRNIPHVDIQNIQTENAAQLAERTDYQALSKFQLNPNQEQSPEYCTQAITAFQRFLSDYPKSDKLPTIQKRLVPWQAELSHVTAGEVKFGDKWMTPEDKRPLVDHWQKQLNVQAAQNALQSLKQQLAALQRQRDSLAKAQGETQGKLAALQTKLASLQDTKAPLYQTTTSSGAHYDQFGHLMSVGQATTTQKLVGEQTIPNPEKPKVQADISFYQQQAATGQQAMSALDAKIKGVQAQIPKSEQDYSVALARLSEPLSQPAVSTSKPATTPAPIVEPTVAPSPVAPTPEPKPWIVRNWKGIVVVGVILLILPMLAYPLLRKADRTDNEREQQARAAREQLKKIFDRMFIEGVRPSGKNTPEGDIFPIGKGLDVAGGGRWFVIGPTHIWAVQNNGRDDDNWVYNNVITDGPGAIGACVAIEEDVAESIRTLSDASVA